MKLNMFDVLASTLQESGFLAFPADAGSAEWCLSREIRQRLMKAAEAQGIGAAASGLEDQLWGYPVRWVDEPDRLEFRPNRPATTDDQDADL